MADRARAGSGPEVLTRDPLRVDPEQSDELVATTPAERMEMRGRSMAGWLRVDVAGVADDAALREWVERGATWAASLPPK